MGQREREKGRKEDGRKVFVKIREKKVTNSIFHELKVFYLVATV